MKRIMDKNDKKDKECVITVVAPSVGTTSRICQNLSDKIGRCNEDLSKKRQQIWPPQTSALQEGESVGGFLELVIAIEATTGQRTKITEMISADAKASKFEE